MSARVCRTIIIGVIWLSTSMFLSFGLPNLRVPQNDAFDMYAFGIFVGVGGAMISTIVIWRSGRKKTVGHAFEVLPVGQEIKR